MLDGYKILTITHRNTALSSIGDFVIKHKTEEEIREQLTSVKAGMHIEEIIYLATCNRVLYLFYTENPLATSFKQDFFRQIQPEIEDETVEQNVVLYEGYEAIDHLFKVASSVNSLVVGEREILRQLREAYDRCQDWNLTGDHLRIAMNAAVVAAKEVYAKTRLGEKSVSVVSLAIKELLKTRLEKNARILMIGAGQTNALVSKFLKKYGYSNVTVFNRTFEKAETIADMLGGTALPLASLHEYQGGFDCMIVCTGSTTAVINEALYARLLGEDSQEKIIIDLAIPNNVSQEVVRQFNLKYIQIEGLKALADENLAFREQEVSNANRLLDEHLETFEVTVRNRQVERALHQIPGEVKAVRERAMNEVFRKEIDTLDDASRLLLERMMTYMEKKCIGIPMKVAKAALVTNA